MFNDPRLLVVDDEAAISYACRRVFSRQGFEVDECNDPEQALAWAREREYVAILLDIKMPSMDGIDFLSELRKSKVDLPVIMMTGFPTISNAAAAVRLGASDYVTKPFTPEEITRAVQATLARRGLQGTEAAQPAARAESWTPATDEFRFWDETWYRSGKDGTVRVGAMLARPREGAAPTVVLPKIGEVVFQGLPVAGLTAGGSAESIPSPISGVIVAVNARLADDGSPLWTDPCGEGWIACIAPTRLEEDGRSCAVRRVVLATTDPERSARQSEQLTRLGCRVRTVADFAQLLPVLQNPAYPAVILDATSFGDLGPEMVGRIHTVKPSMRVVVLGSDAPSREVAYRERGIFYYAVPPFDDGELTEVLHSVYPHGGQEAGRPRGHSEPVHAIGTTSSDNHSVQLVADRGLLVRDHGVGGQIRRELLARGKPLETILGDSELTAVRIAQSAGRCDRLLLLIAKDTGRLPGSLFKDSKREWVEVPGESAEKVTILIVQPRGAALTDLDDRTAAALARHIVDEMSA